jgi:hypothetical protein
MINYPGFGRCKACGSRAAHPRIRSAGSNGTKWLPQASALTTTKMAHKRSCHNLCRDTPGMVQLGPNKWDHLWQTNTIQKQLLSNYIPILCHKVLALTIYTLDNPSTKFTVCYGKSRFKRGRSTISGPLKKIAMLVYWRVTMVIPCHPMSSQHEWNSKHNGHSNMNLCELWQNTWNPTCLIRKI